MELKILSRILQAMPQSLPPPPPNRIQIEREQTITDKANQKNLKREQRWSGKNATKSLPKDEPINLKSTNDSSIENWWVKSPFLLESDNIFPMYTSKNLIIATHTHTLKIEKFRSHWAVPGAFGKTSTTKSKRKHLIEWFQHLCYFHPHAERMVDGTKATRFLHRFCPFFPLTMNKTFSSRACDDGDIFPCMTGIDKQQRNDKKCQYKSLAIHLIECWIVIWKK